MQADRRALNITLNSIGTELTRDDRRKLYSNFGLLYPHGHTELAGAEDFDQIRSAMEKCPPYQAIFNKVGPSLAASGWHRSWEHSLERGAVSFFWQGLAQGEFMQHASVLV